MEADDQGPISYTLDQALSAIGFGRYQFFLLFYAGVGSLAEAMEMMLLSFIGSAVQPEWALSSVQQNLISVLSFSGSLLGAFAWGIFSDSHGRKKVLLGAAIVTSIAGLLSTWAPNYLSFLVLRCFVGVGVGGGHVYRSWFLEFVPTPNRGRWMVVFSAFSTVGTISKALLAWWIMPRFDWRWLLRISVIPHVVSLVFYAFVPESPRYLCMKGKLGDAFDVLKKAALANRKSLPAGSLVSNQINRNSSHDGQTQPTPPTQDMFVQTQPINVEEGAELDLTESREGINESHERIENAITGHSSPEIQEILCEAKDNVEQKVEVGETSKQGGTRDFDEHNENAIKGHSSLEEIQEILGEIEDNQEQGVILSGTENLEGTYDSDHETSEEASPHQPTPNTQNTSAMTQNEGAAVSHREAPEVTHGSPEITEINSESQPPDSTTLLISTENRSSQSERKTYSILLIFSATWFRTTCIVCFLYFANTFSYYGIILLSSQLSTGSPIWQSRNIKDPSLYRNVFITSLAEIPGLVLIAVMVDRVGRKKTMAVMFLLGFILLLPLAVHDENCIVTMVLVFVTRVCMSASFMVTQIYAEEVYPTNLRAAGVGLAIAIGGIGGMLWPLVAQQFGLLVGLANTSNDFV